MKIVSKSDIGLKRSTNQDAFIAGEFENGAVFAVVCDGMGGANAGNVASECAAKIIADYIVKSYSSKMNGTSVENLLRAAVDSANTEVFELSKSDSGYEGMGTTVVAVIVNENLAHIVHVGDSRAYLCTADSLEQLTVDHSIVQNMINNGEISEFEANNHPKKNIITRAIGAEPGVICDYNIAIKPENNSLVLCTDGLTNYVSRDEIYDIIKSTPREEAANVLVDAANNSGGGDNITVVLIY